MTLRIKTSWNKLGSNANKTNFLHSENSLYVCLLSALLAQLQNTRAKALTVLHLKGLSSTSIWLTSLWIPIVYLENLIIIISHMLINLTGIFSKQNWSVVVIKLAGQCILFTNFHDPFCCLPCFEKLLIHGEDFIQ